MQKVMFGVCGCLLLALSFLFWRYISAIKNLENERYKNAMLESSLKTQNEAIQKIKLDSNNFKASAEKREQNIESKYEKAITQTKIEYINTCDLKEFNRLKNLESNLKSMLKARYETKSSK